MRKDLYNAASAMAGALAALSALPAFAQAPDPAAQEAVAPAETSFNDIVVTARRVSERLQDVPVAVTAVQGEQLDALGIRQVIDVRQVVPGLAVSSSAGRTSTPAYAIRGQRSGDVLITQDQPITIYVDEAVVAPLQGSNLGLFDLENVQVLKGPQGTLFGRNTTGGAILFTTAKPTDQFEGSIRLGYGNYDAKTATAVLNVPLSDAIRLRGAIDYTKTDGYGRVVPAPGVPAGPAVGRPLGSRDEFNVRFTAAVDPADWLQTMTTFYHSRANNGAAAFVLLDRPNPAGNAAFVFGSANTDAAFARAQARSVYDAESGAASSFSRARITGVIHTDTIELSDDVTLKNIFSYRRTKNDDNVDFDGTILPLIDTAGHTETDTYSEELQIQGKGLDDRLNYIVGVYYFLLKGIDGTGIPGHLPNVSFGRGTSVYGRVTNKSLSGFAQGTYALTDTMHLTAGVRYTMDQRKVSLTNGNFPLTVCNLRDAAGVVLPANACVINADASFSEPSYLVSIDKKLNDDTLVYLSHRRSFRSGGFNLRADTTERATQPYQPEVVKDVELGLKTSADLSDDVRFNANIAAYYQWYNDVQRNITLRAASGAGILSLTRNAAKAHIYGGEAELGLSFRRLAQLNVNYAYIRPKFDSYVTRTVVAGVPDTLADYSNREFSYIPRHQLNANVTLTPDIGDFGELRLIGSVYYQSKIVFSEDFANRAQLIERLNPAQVPTLPQDLKLGQSGYALANARIELNDIAGSNLSIAGYMRNIFDKRYVDAAIPFQDSAGIDAGVYGAPRTYGLELSYKF